MKETRLLTMTRHNVYKTICLVERFVNCESPLGTVKSGYRKKLT